MFSKLKWVIRIVLFLFVAGWLHYTLPQRDVVKIIKTDSRMTEIGANRIFYGIEDSGTGSETSSTKRDIRYIEAVYPDGATVMVYRNEDTGWLWPPYFKWDSSTLQAEATNASRQPDQWVAVTHYGWRIPMISIFPNAVKVTPVSGPDVPLIPWLNMVIIAFLGAAGFMIRRMWLQFIERTVDPIRANMGEAMDGVENQASGVLGGIKSWLNSWRAKPRQ
jgi:hypothetical protein